MTKKQLRKLSKGDIVQDRNGYGFSVLGTYGMHAKVIRTITITNVSEWRLENGEPIQSLRQLKLGTTIRHEGMHNDILTIVEAGNKKSLTAVRMKKITARNIRHWKFVFRCMYKK
ncbi:MAG: hypothetical protein V4697_01805 [Patescibacteria group bacterium]